MKELLVGIVTVASALAWAQDNKCPVNANRSGRENIEWSISYAYHLTDAKKDLPRVLLVGDSICNGYAGGVAKQLEGVANVTYWISSYCATAPGYLRLLAFYLDADKYDVVHFNNGLHSLSTPTDLWAKSVEAALKLIREKQPNAKIVWTPSTPLKDAKKTEKVRELNAAAAPIAAKLCDATNDLFALEDPLDREENWSDVFHHKQPLRDKESDQVAACVSKFLSPNTNH